jgi:uncharacterized protein
LSAVVDTSPLVWLARLDLLALLPTLFGQTIIPPAVLIEATVTRPDAPGASTIRGAVSEGLVQIVEPAATGGSPRFAGLGPGESEAILLTLDLRPDWLVLDDWPARQLAIGLGLRVTGTVGVLELARNAGHLPRALPLIEELRAGGFRLSDHLMEAVRVAERGIKPES